MEDPKVYPGKELRKAIEQANEFVQSTMGDAMKKAKEIWNGPDDPMPDEKMEVLKKDKQSVQTLPSIEEAVKNPAILSVIWEKCAQLLVFDIDGNFICEGKGKHAVLLAFSYSMKRLNLLVEDVKPTDFYYILCQKYGVEPASRIDKIPKGKTKFHDVLIDFMDFLEELKEI